MPKQVQILSQKQQLVMTSSMHQSIAILQMSNLELNEYASNQLDQNPFLEDATVIEEASAPNEKLKKLEDYKPPLGHNEMALQKRGGNNHNSKNYDYISNVAKKKNIKEYVAEEVNLLFDDPKEKFIATFFVDYLSSSGYLSNSLEELADILKCPLTLLENVLNKLQTLDPPGIFARNLSECLILQLDKKSSNYQNLKLIIQNIQYVANGDLKGLAKVTKININNLSELIKQIRSLNPRPGNCFSIDEVSYNIPDVYFSFDEAGNIMLEPNSDILPKLRVNNNYYKNIKDSLKGNDQKQFTKNEIDKASLVVKSIDQRLSTIMKISTIIISEQVDFFKHGILHLKPMTLSYIAEKAGFNESTVSRSTANKYISTPLGIFELKYFFSSSLQTKRASSDHISSTKVKEIIKQIIMSEEEGEINSDDDIATQLVSFNINIARRTVAKYREAMNIPSSAVRKRTFKMKNIYS